MTTKEDIEYQNLTPLFDQLADPATPEESRTRVRNALVTGYLPLATHIARRYARRGQPVEDLEQVARVGLIHAIDRFDPALGYRFLSFAIPTITGEVRRYFRDLSWSVTVPRDLQDRCLAIGKAAGELGQQLGCSPRPRQIAEWLGIPVEEVYEGLRAGLAYRTDPLDRPDSDEYRTNCGPAQLMEVDVALELVEDRETLYQALAELPRRDASVVTMRFFGNMTQTQIAQRLGISQMHVSRLLSKSLIRLRGAFTEPKSEAR